MDIDLASNLSGTMGPLTLLLVPAIDMILKSGVILGLVALLIFALKRHLTPALRHLFWMLAAASIALLPFLALLKPQPAPHLPSNSAFELITVAIEAPVRVADKSSAGGWLHNEAIGWHELAIGAYVMVSLVLLLKMLLAARRVFAINRSSTQVTSLPLVKRVNQHKRQMGIYRPLAVKFSEQVASPLSFGLIRPVIIFPKVAEQWPDREFSNALVHELGHISRFDWLSSTCVLFLSSLLWINPCMWIALGRLNLEAEKASDQLVLQHGSDSATYAEDLVAITRSCIQAARPRLLAQRMVSAHLLQSRIVQLLNDQPASLRKTISAATAALLFGLMVLTVLISGSFLQAIEIQRIPITSGGASALPSLNYSVSANRLAAILTEAERQTVRKPVADYSVLPVSVSDNPGRYQAATSRLRALRENLVNSASNQNPLTISAADAVPALQLALGHDTANLPQALDVRAVVNDTALKPPASQQPVPENRLSRAQLMAEIERTETEYYRVFNSGVADDSLHVVCDDYRPLGSNIPARYCEPKFVIESRSFSLREAPGVFTRVTSDISLRSANSAKFKDLTEALNQALAKNEYFRELHGYLHALKSSL